MPAWPTLYPKYLEYKQDAPYPYGTAYDTKTILPIPESNKLSFAIYFSNSYKNYSSNKLNPT